MRNSLKGKNILHGVTGSIAGYKAIDIIRRLKEQGVSVRPIMTNASKNFLTPLSLEIASEGKVCSGLFSDPMSHITLTRDADLVLIAPATANIIGKFANGIADDLLSTCLISFRGKVVVAPAMNWRMYENPAFRRNLDYLKAQGVIEVPPEKGPLACGEEGTGRMADGESIIEAVKTALTVSDLSGKRIVVTAGPTREYIDTVRFISNRSTGKMGYALARVAVRRGAEVTLISGPSSLRPPSGVGFIPVETANEMRNAVRRQLKGSTALIMVAAVTDFTPQVKFKTKLKKSSLSSLKLEKTPDILSEIGSMKQRPLLIGFAAEAGDKLKRAKEKLLSKGADIMVFNDINIPGSGFESDTNKIVIIDKKGKKEYPLLTKEEASEVILDRISSGKGLQNFRG